MIQLKKPGSKICLLKVIYMSFQIRISEYLVTKETDGLDNWAASTSYVIAPSLIKQPRIVFTGVYGAVTIKMKEVSKCSCLSSIRWFGGH